MKKFKIKNRQKRKYVKKRDLASSLSSVQSITVGLVPLLLMAIAFFATVFMYNPPVKNLPVAPNSLNMPTLPAFDIPKINLTFSIPELPKMSLPEAPKFSPPAVLTMPKIALPKLTMPRLILPNFGTSLLSIMAGVSHTITTWIQTMIKIADIVEIQLTVFAIRTIAHFDPRPQFISISQAIVSLSQKSLHSLSSGIIFVQRIITEAVSQFVSGSITATQNTLRSLQATAGFILHITSQAVKIITMWLQNIYNAIIKAVSDVIWILGTPFRVIANSLASINKSMEPFYNWMGRSIENTSNELSIGGDNLMKGSAFVGSTIEKNYGNK